MYADIVSMIIIGGLIIGIAYLFFTTRHRERMRLLDNFKDYPELFPKDFFRADALKYGLLAIGIAVGSSLGYFLDENNIMEEEIAYTTMVFLFGGLGLVASYLILRNE